MSSFTDFENKVKEIQAEYYAETSKNRFFKKKQKQECAQHVAANIDINELLHYLVYIIPGTNRIFMDYMVLKTFANESVYKNIIDKFITLIDECIAKTGSYEFYFNIDTLTPSGFERYQGIFPLFYQVSDANGRSYSENMTKCEMLNAPTVIDIIIQIARPFMDKKTRDMIRIHNKEETKLIVANIFSA